MTWYFGKCSVIFIAQNDKATCCGTPEHKKTLCSCFKCDQSKIIFISRRKKKTIFVINYELKMKDPVIF